MTNFQLKKKTLKVCGECNLLQITQHQNYLTLSILSTNIASLNQSTSPIIKATSRHNSVTSYLPQFSQCHVCQTGRFAVLHGLRSPWVRAASVKMPILPKSVFTFFVVIKMFSLPLSVTAISLFCVNILQKQNMLLRAIFFP